MRLAEGFLRGCGTRLVLRKEAPHQGAGPDIRVAFASSALGGYGERDRDRAPRMRHER